MLRSILQLTLLTLLALAAGCHNPQGKDTDPTGPRPVPAGKPDNPQDPAFDGVDERRQAAISLNERGCPIAAVPRLQSCSKSVSDSEICAQTGQGITWDVPAVPARDRLRAYRIVFVDKGIGVPTDCGEATKPTDGRAVTRCVVNRQKESEYYYKIEAEVADGRPCELDPIIFVNSRRQ